MTAEQPSSHSPYHVIYTLLRTDIGDAVHPRVESKQSP